MKEAVKPAVRERRDVEDLVSWTLIDNGLGGQFSGDCQSLHWTDLGTRVSSGGWAMAGPRVSHEDAVRIAETITRLPSDAAALVVQHGRIGERPDWCEEGEGRWEQARNKRGQLEWHYEVPGNRRSAKTPRMVFVGETAERVRWYRAAYRVWWLGLEALVEPLNGLLDRFEATGPRAAAEPWDGPKVFGPGGVVVEGLQGQGSAMRLAALRMRGPIELPAPEVANAQASGSASRGGEHGRS